MPIKVNISIVNENQFIFELEKRQEQVRAAVQAGINEGADEVRDYIKYTLLSGTPTGMYPGSLPVKIFTRQLRNALYVRREKNKMTVLFRKVPHIRAGDESPIMVDVLAAIIDQGLGSSRWTKIRHPGIKAYHFMREGMNAKKKRVGDLVRAHVYSALRSN